MIDKELMGLLGDKKKYIVYTVISMVIGLGANLGITMCICQAIRLTLEHVTLGEKPLGTEFCGFLYNKQERSHKTPSLLVYSYDSLFSIDAFTNPLNKGCGRFGLDFSSG